MTLKNRNYLDLEFHRLQICVNDFVRSKEDLPNTTMRVKVSKSAARDSNDLYRLMSIGEQRQGVSSLTHANRVDVTDGPLKCDMEIGVASEPQLNGTGVTSGVHCFDSRKLALRAVLGKVFHYFLFSGLSGPPAASVPAVTRTQIFIYQLCHVRNRKARRRVRVVYPHVGGRD